MGLMDKAKDKIKEKARNIGEETIRVVDYDDYHEKKEAPEKNIKKNEQKIRNKKEIQKKRPVKQKRPTKKTISAKDNKIEPEKKITKTEEPIIDHSYTPEVEEEIVENIESNSINDSVFDLPDDGKDYFRKQEEVYSNHMKEYENSSIPDIKSNSIQDILELLQIKPTFEIPEDVFLKEDLNNISFDIQVPQGYEFSQVNVFFEKVKTTVNHFEKLLKIRNEDIAKLATTVDRLQVDVNKLRLDQEINNGINIMPTEDDDNLQNENLELRLYIKRLEESLENKENNNNLSSEERESYNAIQDKLSILQRENSNLKEENNDLRNSLAVYEDEEDDEIMPISNDFNNSSFDMSDNELPNIDNEDNFIKDNDQLVKDSTFFNDEEESLTDYIDNNSQYFQAPDEEGNSTVDFMDADNDNSSVFFADEDDDELDKIFQEDRNNQ